MNGFKSITVKYGITPRTTTVPENATFGDVLCDNTNKVVLGYGDKVQALYMGVVQDNGSIVPDGATVEVEAKANEKAV